MFTNAGNSAFSRDFYVQTDFDKTALDDIFGNFIKLKKYAKGKICFCCSTSKCVSRRYFCQNSSLWVESQGPRLRSHNFHPGNPMFNVGCLFQKQVFATDEAATGSVMDPASGLFTAGRDGIYKVSFSQIF